MLCRIRHSRVITQCPDARHARHSHERVGKNTVFIAWEWQRRRYWIDGRADRNHQRAGWKAFTGTQNSLVRSSSRDARVKAHLDAALPEFFQCEISQSRPHFRENAVAAM